MNKKIPSTLLKPVALAGAKVGKFLPKHARKKAAMALLDEIIKECSRLENLANNIKDIKLFHDFRAPFSNLRALLQLEMENIENPQKLFELSQIAAKRIKYVKEALIRRSGGKTFFPRKQSFSNLVESIKNVVDYELLILDTLNIQCLSNFNLTPATKSRTVFVDEVGLQRVVQNLVKNATDHLISEKSVHRNGSEPGKISINAFLDDKLRITVSDNGLGMPEEQIRKFYARENISTKGGKHGFGLQIVREIVEAHNGTIKIESEQGKGTTFKIEIPLEKR